VSKAPGFAQEAAFALMLVSGCGTATMPQKRGAGTETRRIVFASHSEGAPGFSIEMPADVIREPPDGP
jgi:hypothetical protein